MNVTCPACHQSIEMPSNHGSLSVECPACGHYWDATEQHALDQPAGVNIGKRLAIVGVPMIVIVVLVFLGRDCFDCSRGSCDPVTAARSDIANMEAAVASCKVDLNNVPYLPSRIMLCKNIKDYTNNEIALVKSNQVLAAASQKFLMRAFGRRLWYNDKTVQWDGGQSSTPNGPWILHADQSLVFWLGGIPGPGGATRGFSTDPTDPANSASGATRKGPYFDFKASRMSTGSMYSAHSNQPVPSPDPTNNGFYRYLDPFGLGVPYLYFSSYREGNDYEPTVDFPSGVWPLSSPALAWKANPLNTKRDLSGNSYVYIQGGVQGSNVTVSPYANPVTGRFINPSGFQILCAGPDGIFGQGGSWNPAGSTMGNGADDLGSFSAMPLGADAR